MRVIDGMHRLMAASMQGRETIDVIFFSGSEADVFLRAVQENVAHGLPLSRADRSAAVARIIASHPHMSDRAIAHSVGLAAKTVAAIRKSSGTDVPGPNARVGLDGKVRPLDSGGGRRRAAELLTEQPDASLRDAGAPQAYPLRPCYDGAPAAWHAANASTPQNKPRRARAPLMTAGPAAVARHMPWVMVAWCRLFVSGPGRRYCPIRPPRWKSCCGTHRCGETRVARGCCGCCTPTPSARSSCCPRLCPRIASASCSGSPASTH